VRAGSIALVALALGANSLYGAWKGAQQGNYRNAARSALAAGSDVEMLRRLYPKPEDLLERRTLLMKHRLSVFSY